MFYQRSLHLGCISVVVGQDVGLVVACDRLCVAVIESNAHVSHAYAKMQ